MEMFNKHTCTALKNINKSYKMIINPLHIKYLTLQ